jgi:hypothetical protein
LCYDQNLFPTGYTSYTLTRLSYVYTNKAHGGDVLITVTTSLGSCRRRYDSELCSECVWVEITTVDGIGVKHSELLGFWTLSILGYSKDREHNFWKLDLFLFSGVGEDTYTVGSLRKS